MSTAHEPWLRPSTRLRERPRAMAAVSAVALILLAAGLGVGMAIGGTGPARRDDRAERSLTQSAQRSASAAGVAQAQVARLRAQNRRLGARARGLRARKDYWKRRYASLRRRR